MGGDEATIAVLLALPAAIVLVMFQRHGLLPCCTANTKRVDARHRAILAKPDYPRPQQQPPSASPASSPAARAEHEASKAAVSDPARSTEGSLAATGTTTTTCRIILAAGCFWGVQLAFQRLPGVRSTAVGYVGGQGRNPTYQHVSSGRSGHAEAVQIEYDPDVISLQELFVVFFSIHNPTALNRQGNDVGTQYRSAIFFDGEEEKLEVSTQRR